MDAQPVVVSKEEVLHFVRSCLMAEGGDGDQAAELAEVLVVGDYRGHFSHGLNRLDMYLDELSRGFSAKSGKPAVLSQKGATAWVDGRNLLGPTVANFCTDLAIRKAKATGIGWVVAKNSNHFGIAGYYAMRMAEAGVLGMAFTNTQAVIYPSRASEAGVGTNPISLATPGRDSYVLDMATSTVALGKVEIAQRRGEKMPHGWAVDGEGNETLDPDEVFVEESRGLIGGLLPLGGTERSGGYKGYGLSMMVEIFTGILAGSNYAKYLPARKTQTTSPNLGQCFVAIDPSAFAPGFDARMEDLVEMMRRLPRVNAEEPVMIAGDPERAHMAKCDDLGGIPYHPNQIEHAAKTAARLGVEPMKALA